MTWFLIISLALETTAAITAVLLAQRRPEHRPAAIALVLLALAAGSLKLAACSAVDPNPPDPHANPHGPTGEPLESAPPDASDASEDRS